MTIEPEDPYERVRQAVAARLGTLTPDLTDDLRTFIGRPFPKRVREVEFYVTEDDFSHCFPIAFECRDDRANLVGEGMRGEVLPGRPPLLGADDEVAYDERDPEGYWRGYVAELVTVWFADCWKTAGGNAYPRRAFIRGHDSVRRYDLVRQAWEDGRGNDWD